MMQRLSEAAEIKARHILAIDYSSHEILAHAASAGLS